MEFHHRFRASNKQYTIDKNVQFPYYWKYVKANDLTLSKEYINILNKLDPKKTKGEIITDYKTAVIGLNAFKQLNKKYKFIIRKIENEKYKLIRIK